MSAPILYTIDVNTPTSFRAATLAEIMAGARHALSLRIRRGTVFDSPKATEDYLTARLAQREHKVFTLIFGTLALLNYDMTRYSPATTSR
jgi:DNA repair protein RadC